MALTKILRHVASNKQIKIFKGARQKNSLSVCVIYLIYFYSTDDLLLNIGNLLNAN